MKYSAHSRPHMETLLYNQNPRNQTSIPTQEEYNLTYYFKLF